MHTCTHAHTICRVFLALCPIFGSVCMCVIVDDDVVAVDAAAVLVVVHVVIAERYHYTCYILFEFPL
jgi:hypothetical protein